MNINNVVLVRAINYVPFDGILTPSSDGFYLRKDNLSDYKGIINEYILKELEKTLGRSINIWDDEEREVFDKFAKDYYPYSSSYTSTISFSLNGLVPDDINNKFSDLEVAVIEPIKHHQNDDFVNIDVIDTTIKGSIKLSNDAILLISENKYNELTDVEKEKIESFYQVVVFQGNIKDAIKTTLEEKGIPSLSLIQSRANNDMEESEYKNSMIEFQDKFASDVGASRLKLQFLYTSPIASMDAIDADAAKKVKSDFDKNLVVEKYYRDEWYKFLVNKAADFGITLSDEEMFYLFSKYSNSREILEQLLAKLIPVLGDLSMLKNYVEEFDNSILENYFTNEEIIRINSDTVRS